jgi:hypothetical protein
MPIPADLSDPNNMSAILINYMLREEQVVRQRAPLDNEIFVELRRVAHASTCDDLANMLLRNIVTLGRYIGPRLSEYAQKNQKKVDVHTYPLGTTVIKAFTANEFLFYDAKKHIIMDLCPESIKSVVAVKITWRIQKNRQNGQSITHYRPEISGPLSRPKCCQDGHPCQAPTTAGRFAPCHVQN